MDTCVRHASFFLLIDGCCCSNCGGGCGGGCGAGFCGDYSSVEYVYGGNGFSCGCKCGCSIDKAYNSFGIYLGFFIIRMLVVDLLWC